MMNVDKVCVVSRLEAMTLQKQDNPWSVISVRCSCDDPVKFADPMLVDALHMQFDDINKVKRDLIAFCYDDAEKIWDFVERVWDPSDLLVVHCLAGISRSPAIAAAICKVKYGDDTEWFKRRSPNMRVYRGMLEVAHKRGLL